MNANIISVEQTFNVSPAVLWIALTDKREMKKWYFDLVEFRPEVGFRFSFTGGPSPERQYVHHCEITEAIPLQKLTYSWAYEGYRGVSYVTFELFPQKSKTLLTLTHSGIDSFPADEPDLAIENFRQGWNSIINESLKNYIASL